MRFLQLFNTVENFYLKIRICTFLKNNCFLMILISQLDSLIFLLCASKTLPTSSGKKWFLFFTTRIKVIARI